jgi:signal transduction histidine kinase
VRLVADIGERKHAESDQARLQAALTHAAREWQLTFDAVETPLLVAGLDGRVTRLNRAAQRLAGRGFPDLLGRPVAELGAGEPWRTAAALIAHAVGRRGSRSVSTYDTAAGRSWELAASVYVGPAAADERVIVVMRDVSGLVRLQESLRRSEMMSALGTLVAGVAHEVRNPLFALSAVLDAFESRFGDQEAHRSYLHLVKAQVQRLNALMQQLLDYGKPLALELAPGRLEEAAAEAAAGCAALAAGRGVEVAVEAAPDLPAVPMDRARLVQAFSNLVDNAVLHSPRGGRVRIALAADGAGNGGGAWVAGRIEDAGPGFRPEDLTRVFDPFFSRRRGGTGLGLSIVQRVVEQHGGRIAAGNRPGGGAVMELRLPAAPPPAARPAAETA